MQKLSDDAQHTTQLNLHKMITTNNNLQLFLSFSIKQHTYNIG